MIYNVAVIGAGVIGALTARELSRYNLKIAILERANDVAMGTTKANSAIIHGGYDAEPGSLKAKFNVEGTAMMEELTTELNVPFKNDGSLVLAFSVEEKNMLKELYRRGLENGVHDMKIIGPEETRELEPHVSNKVVAALYSGTAGIVCPYELTIAAAENAVVNGAEFFRNTEVKAISYNEELFTIETNNGTFKAEYVINAAGTHCDEVARMIGDDSINIISRAGEYYLMDKAYGDLATRVLFQCPNKMGKGALVTPTVDGNLLVGPTAVDQDDKDNVDTSVEGLKSVIEKAQKSVPEVTVAGAITSFAGVRAHDKSGDFIIGPSKVNDRFINLAGIESPGLSSAPAIAVAAANIIKEKENPSVNYHFDPIRPAPIKFREMNDEERAELIKKDSRYGRIVCRCESVTEGEILDAINSVVGARDMDAVKRRTRAGMGRCQSGFCGSKIVELISSELGIPMEEVTKFGGDSKVVFERTK